VCSSANRRANRSIEASQLNDPHGDLATTLHEHLQTPHHYFDVSDPDCPLGYNRLARVLASLRPLVTSGLIDQPQADIRDIVRLYTDKAFRKVVIARIRDEQVRAFWTSEFPNMNYMNAIDGVAPIANKLGAFLAQPVIRRAICEPAQPLRFRQIMDRGEVVIVNLAKGRLGTDMANVMGGLIVSTIMHAAFSRGLSD
jgi:hypothetical protein